MIVLKCVSRAARNRIRNAPSTATIAKSSGITVGTSARNRTIRMKKRGDQADDVADALRRRRALGLAGELDLDAGRLADRAQLVLEVDDAASAAARSPSGRTARRRTRPGRPSTSWCESGSSGLVIGRDVARLLGRASLRTSVAGGEHLLDGGLARRACRAACPSGAASTTRSAAPFCAPNLALIRSVAFCVSDPGILKSLISLPWNAAFRPISTTKMPSQPKTTRHGWRAQRVASPRALRCGRSGRRYSGACPDRWPSGLLSCLSERAP